MRQYRAAILLLALSACAPVPAPRRSPYHAADADLTVTRIVHGSVIVDMAGTRVLVDPWFHSGLITRHKEPLGITPAGLPTVAAILLTHRHPDRFDPRALRDLVPSVPEVIAPAGLRQQLVELGFRTVTPLGWWDRTQVGTLAVTAVPALHAVPENGYVLEGNGVAVYVAGDTRTFPELADIATRFPHLDAALLPVGGERLLGLRREMGPDEAARAAVTLGAQRVIPIGYGERGAFPFSWHARHPVERFVDACTDRGLTRNQIVILEPGESWHYYR